jgi:predicted metalloprotease with PDZ domain
MKYTISYQRPEQQFIDISLLLQKLPAEPFFEVQLAAWRPGRYELGNFAKNVQKFSVLNDKDKAVNFEKVSKDRWRIHHKGAKSVTINYNYFAAEINAGSTWLDETMLYMNPVNCLIFMPARMLEPVSIQFKLPKNYEIATGMKLVKPHLLEAKDVQQLLDCPLIASANLQHDTFKVENSLFHLWFAGECKPEWKRLKQDFSAYTREQIKAFGSFPVPEYHYLVLARPDKVYHGVEHTNSTVISLGPGYAMFNSDRYYDLLAVCSHELYHTWNIKQIRPVEMLPYDFTKENYSRLGYVAEGVTTYMGDVMPVRSEGFGESRFFLAMSNFVQKYYDNFGRHNLSVAESSFDTWLDGYSKGIPDRKVSIYNEGALNAFVCDMLVREGSKNKHSLDTVMRDLYETIALQGKAYDELAYKSRLEKYSGESFTSYFKDFINGTKPLDKMLSRAFAYFGLQLIEKPAAQACEALWGMKVEWGAGRFLVTQVHPGSPAEEAKIYNGDEILYINSFRLDNNLNEWLNYFNGEALLQIKRHNKLVDRNIKANKNIWFKQYSVAKLTKASAEQRKNYLLWSGRNY